jgi:hypothetical protein
MAAKSYRRASILCWKQPKVMIMLDATHPSTYSVYWTMPALKNWPRPNVLVISLAIFAATLIGSGAAVASQFEKLPAPEHIAAIPPGAEGMNVYPVVETTDIWLAPTSVK